MIDKHIKKYYNRSDKFKNREKNYNFPIANLLRLDGSITWFSPMRVIRNGAFEFFLNRAFPFAPFRITFYLFVTMPYDRRFAYFAQGQWRLPAYSILLQ